MTCAQKIEDALKRVHNQESFIQELLIDALAWPVPEQITRIEDISFSYSGEDLRVDGLEKHVEDGRIAQIQPLESNQPFGIFLLEFKNENVFTTGRGMTVPLRKVLRGLVPKQRRDPSLAAWNRENLLLICTHNYEYFRFACFKAPKNGSGLPRLATFGWGPDIPARTACEFNLPELVWPDDGAADGEWVAKWASAFDVERVTKRFYEEYEECFEFARRNIRGDFNDEERKIVAQTLFNRLMFLRFVERKGWLEFQGRRDYLRALFEAGGADGMSFYRGRLIRLFFEGLAIPDHRAQEVIGSVPFLNGGLFALGEYDDRIEDIPDAVFEKVLGKDGLFYRYNFTVEESTPLDVDVAVDPEMLGKVFEELVTGRHETGSYYTPKPIVAFMCKEGLRGYLQSAVPSESSEAVERFVEEHDASGLKNPEAVLEALRRVKVCDPACGSGAYLLGMLHELFELRAALFATRNVDAISAYNRKLEIIQNNIYGVDNDPFAVNIARLRLWLSLAVEYDDDNPPPLPNLDFKIEEGDSVLAANPMDVKMQLHEDLVRSFVELKRSYLSAHGGDKITIGGQIESVRKSLMSWAHSGSKTGKFDWAVDFAEVFFPASRGNVTFTGAMAGVVNVAAGQMELAANGEVQPGFDIVLANPPYIRQELIKNLKPNLREVYGDLYGGTADLYVYFYYRSLQLLKQSGVLVFISSNKWLRANYGKKLRAFIAEAAGVRSITDFGELPVFEAATFPMIIVAQKGVADVTSRFTQVKSLDEPYPDVRALIQEQGQDLPDDAISGENWTLTDRATAIRLRKMRAAGIPLGEYVKGKIYRGILTGFNRAFVIDGAKRAELIAEDPKSDEIIKPLAVGDDIRKWHIRRKDRWLVFTRRGIEIDAYPAIKEYLEAYRERLEPRPKDWNRPSGEWPGRKPGSYEWYEIQDDIAYYAEFEKPKIVFPDIAKEPRFTMAAPGLYSNDTTFILSVKDHYLLGILNSSQVWGYLTQIAAVLGNASEGGRMRLKHTYVGKVPIPDALRAERDAIAELAQKCLDAEGVGCEEWEAEIDERVARLYGVDAPKPGEGGKL